MLLQKLIQFSLSQPDDLAVVTAQRPATYADLADRARYFADVICHLPSVTPQAPRIIIDVVDVTDRIACMFGVLGANRTFYVLDRSQTEERNSRILSLIGSDWALTDATSSATSSLYSNQACNPIGLVDLGAARSRVRTDFRPEDAGYIVFTSGSTGEPKGVRHPEKNLVQFVDWQARAFKIGRGSTVAQLAAPTFDVSLCEIMGALWCGGTVAVPSHTQRQTPRDLHSWIREAEVSCAQAIPSVLLNLARMGKFEQRLECLASVGEPLRESSVKEIFGSASNERFQLFNLYGPTETIAATYKCLDHSKIHEGYVPVGKPIEGRVIRVLDETSADLQTMRTGEVVIETAYSCKNYLNGSRSDAGRFRPGNSEGMLLYKTGDLGFIDSHGDLNLVGRSDRQVKISGVRIEIDPIELAIKNSGLVDECIVRTNQSKSGDCYLEVLLESNHDISRDELDLVLVGLPQTHWPKYHVCHPKLPRLHNGKLDRNASTDSILRTRTGPVQHQEILEQLRRTLNIFDLAEDDPTARIAANSLELAGLVEVLRREFGPVAIENVIGARDVRELMSILHAIADRKE